MLLALTHKRAAKTRAPFSSGAFVKVEIVIEYAASATQLQARQPASADMGALQT